VFLIKLTTMAAAFSGHVLNGNGCCVASNFGATVFPSCDVAVIETGLLSG
jgi:hypothetical protein